MAKFYDSELQEAATAYIPRDYQDMPDRYFWRYDRYGKLLYPLHYDSRSWYPQGWKRSIGTSSFLTLGLLEAYLDEELSSPESFVAVFHTEHSKDIISGHLPILVRIWQLALKRKSSLPDASELIVDIELLLLNLMNIEGELTLDNSDMLALLWKQAQQHKAMVADAIESRLYVKTLSFRLNLSGHFIRKYYFAYDIQRCVAKDCDLAAIAWFKMADVVSLYDPYHNSAREYRSFEDVSRMPIWNQWRSLFGIRRSPKPSRHQLIEMIEQDVTDWLDFTLTYESALTAHGELFSENPEEHIVASEDREVIKDALYRIEHAVSASSDAALHLVLEAIITKGLDRRKRRDFAKQTGISPEELARVLRRFDRLLQNFFPGSKHRNRHLGSKKSQNS